MDPKVNKFIHKIQMNYFFIWIKFDQCVPEKAQDCARWQDMLTLTFALPNQFILESMQIIWAK